MEWLIDAMANNQELTICVGVAGTVIGMVILARLKRLLWDKFLDWKWFRTAPEPPPWDHVGLPTPDDWFDP